MCSILDNLSLKDVDLLAFYSKCLHTKKIERRFSELKASARTFL
jgi:hypothetical protein